MREIQGGDKTTARLAYIIILAAIVYNLLPFAPGVTPPPKPTDLFELLAVGVIGYYSGSSKGSKDKTPCSDTGADMRGALRRSTEALSWRYRLLAKHAAGARAYAARGC